MHRLFGSTGYGGFLGSGQSSVTVTGSLCTGSQINANLVKTHVVLSMHRQDMFSLTCMQMVVNSK